ncbi:MAG TPA: hypothetical protein VJQ55_12195 [Candidatus Binatia bacterium]|nr:hypothetical protein [Candidatus Binatia bacterium]
MSFSAEKIGLNEHCKRPGPGRRPRKRLTNQVHRFNLFYLLGVFLLIDSMAPGPARAEVLIEARVGFHGVFQLGRPFPLDVELNNTGRPAEGVLEVQVWKGGATKGGAAYLANYRRDVFLAGRSRKTVQLTVDPDFISRPLAIRFHSPEATAGREIDLRRHFSPAPVLLVMSGSSVLPPITFSAAAQSRLVSVGPQELAGDSRALLGVSHLILYEQSLRELSRAQLLALDHWLLAGGRMLILGSLNYAVYQETALARFLPVRVNGAKQISFAPDAEGGKKVSLAGVWAQSSTLVSGKALAEADGMPIIVQANRGRGTITYLAVDVGRPPLSEWSGLGKFLQALLAPTGTEEPPPRTEWNDAVFNQLIASPKFLSAYVPAASLFFGMLAYLIGVGALAWLWQRKRFAPRLLLLGLSAFVGVGTAAGYVHFSRGGNIPDGVLLVSTVLENNSDGFADTQANLALFSTQLRQYDLQLERGWIDLTPVSSRTRENSEPTVVTQEVGGVSRYRLPLREWDYRLFRLRRIDRFPFTADFENQGEQLAVRVDNRSDKDLVQCWLLLPGQRFDLGTIARGSSWRRTFPLANGKAKEQSTIGRSDSLNLRELSFADKTRDILFHSSLFPRDADPRLAGGAAVLVGWVKDPERRVRIDDPQIQVQDYALFRAVFPLASGDDE